MSKPTKVRFNKKENGKLYLSAGYYLDQKDFEDRNCTLIFVEMTSIVKPPVVKKEEK